MLGKVFDKLSETTAGLMMVVGSCLLVLAAAGRVPSTNPVIELVDPVWRGIVGFLGIVVFLVAFTHSVLVDFLANWNIRGRKSDAVEPYIAPDFAGNAHLVRMFTNFTGPNRLHFIGLYRGNHVLLHTHCLKHAKVQSLFHYRTKPEAMSDDLMNIGLEIYSVVEYLTNQFRNLGNGLLIRNVFDVERGALYYYHLYDNVYLFGVTFSQAKVDLCDRQMRRHYHDW